MSKQIKIKRLPYIAPTEKTIVGKKTSARLFTGNKVYQKKTNYKKEYAFITAATQVHEEDLKTKGIYQS